MDINDASHKVLVVLDHGPRCARDSESGLTVTLKNGNADAKDVAAIRKSIWTWSVEAAIELHRIISDVYPDNDKLLRFVMADCVGRQLQSNWGGTLVDYNELCNALITAGPASKGDVEDVTIRSGITLAIEALSELTETQQQKKRSLEIEKSKKRKREVAGEEGELNSDGEERSEDEEGEESDDDDETGEERAQRIDREEELGDDDIEEEGEKEKRPEESGDESGEETDELLMRRLLNRPVSRSLLNTGSIVVFSSFFNDAEVKELEEFVSETIESRNKNINLLNSDSFAEISKVKLFIMNTYPSNGKSAVKAKELTQVSPSLFSSVISATCGESLIRTTHTLSIRLYDLVSTTISGIPMKEEAQPGQSVNYDVELLHPRAVHAMLESLGLLSEGQLLSPVPELSYSTVRLSWATPSPKNKWNLFPRVFLSVPVTTTAVCSRPSACLTSFLLNGRNVMLEVKAGRDKLPASLLPNVGQKIISHTLIAHEGRIYIHSIYLGKLDTYDNKTLRKKYLISADKRVRTHDFRRYLMKECTLYLNRDNENEVATDKEVKETIEHEPCDAAIERAGALLRYWPVFKDNTLLRFEGSKYEAMFNLLRQAELSTADVDKCKQAISQILALRDSKDLLYPTDIICSKLKNPSTREEQFSVLIREIRDHILNYVEHSERHFEVFNLFVQVMNLERSTNVVINNPQATSSFKSNLTSKPAAAKKYAHMNKKPDPRLAKEDRASPPPPYKKAKADQWEPGEKVNLYAMLCEQENERGKEKWKEFVGRANAAGNQALLYPHLNIEQTSAPAHGNE